MRVVLDASAAVAIALGRKEGGGLQELLSEAEVVLAPELLIPEVVNTIWKYHQFERMDLDTCERALQSAIALVDDLVPGAELHREAFLMARTSNHPAYDMFYLALSRREDALFVTTDRALRREAQRQGIRCFPEAPAGKS